MSVVHIEVSGRVQGIGFRWFVRERAKALDLAGWVKNLENGGVEIAAAGSKDDVARLLSAVSHGPMGAVVQKVIELPAVAEDTLPRPFAILR